MYENTWRIEVGWRHWAFDCLPAFLLFSSSYCTVYGMYSTVRTALYCNAASSTFGEEASGKEGGLSSSSLFPLSLQYVLCTVQYVPYIARVERASHDRSVGGTNTRKEGKREKKKQEHIHQCVFPCIKRV